MTQESTSSLLSKATVVILCGGKGPRMGSDRRHKVCFPIDGVPAIIRTVKLFYQQGLRKVVIVVGAMAGDVVATVGQEFPQVMFVYQHQQLGTGHAAQVGINALQNVGFAGSILITMGDKFIEPQALNCVCEKFLRQRADMVFVSGPKRQNPGAGRVVADKTGRILGNIEERDIQLARVFGALKKLGKAEKDGKIGYDRVVKIGQKFIANEAKLVKAALLRLQQSFRQVRILGFDAAVTGDIPQAAGLSSSSSLVVASAQVAEALKREYYQPAQIKPMIHICQPVEGSGIISI